MNYLAYLLNRDGPDVSVALVTAARGRQLLDKMTDPPGQTSCFAAVRGSVRVRSTGSCCFQKNLYRIMSYGSKKGSVTTRVFCPGGSLSCYRWINV